MTETTQPCTGFGKLFATAFGKACEPYAWQRRLAEGEWPEVLIAPTGSGKTVGVTLAWAHQRLLRPERTPRRLVWCLPMRTLVDQICGEIHEWLERIEADVLDPQALLPRPGGLHVLMGGVDSGRWLETPENPAIIVGTQDMLLSRALMRGYASSRAIWPMEFAMLHQDAQWIFDEVQLMGAGRATSAQLEAFRRMEHVRSMEKAVEGDAVRWTAPARRGASVPPEYRSSAQSRSLWISATLKPEWLATVDHPEPSKVFRVDPTNEVDDRLSRLTEAPKRLWRIGDAPASAASPERKAYLERLADSVVEAHRPGTMTLAILNQVKRAQELHEQVRHRLAVREDLRADVALLHSRFRPPDRKREMSKFLEQGGSSDIIVIATQAVEAGVDISATTMFTELAPWASMVQRFGRANRRAEVKGGARIFWIDLLRSIDEESKQAEELNKTLSLPYEVDRLRDARRRLIGLTDAAPVHLPHIGEIDPTSNVIRRNDLDDLFDTDADLTGFDVDVSPFVRDSDDTDLRVFWRELPVKDADPPKPEARELCALPVGQAKAWVRNAKKSLGAVFFVRDPQWRRKEQQTQSTPPGWTPLYHHDTLRPGMTVLADVRAGGYGETLGFTGDRKHRPDPVGTPGMPDAPGASTESTPAFQDALGAIRDQEGESEGHDDDPRSSTGRPVRLTDHLKKVASEVSSLCDELGTDDATRCLLVRAARWHDLGKAHEVFQATMRKGLNGRVPDGVLLAKTVKGGVRHKRPYFRHELASALAFLGHEGWSREADLCAYLIAAHHGKVRMNLRALPKESPPTEPERLAARFARGIWEGDELPPVELDATERWPGGRLNLSIMELGWDETTRESWTERTRELLRYHGPFRLAWLETILRLADWRASAEQGSGGRDGR